MLFLVKNVLLSSIHRSRCDLDSIKVLSCAREEILSLREGHMAAALLVCQIDLRKPPDPSLAQGLLG